MIKRILVVGGASGIGLAISEEMANRDGVEKVYVVDKSEFALEYSHPNRYTDIDALVITAGFGRLSLFRDIPEHYIMDSFDVNTIPVMRLVKRFYNRLESPESFYCGVIVSIAGFMSSPFLAVYGATKAALKIFIESVNVELKKNGSGNQILNVSPGSIPGTAFNSGKNDLSLITGLAKEIIEHLEAKDDLFIPKYEEVFRGVLERYHEDFRAEGAHSYDYKIASGRVKVE